MKKFLFPGVGEEDEIIIVDDDPGQTDDDPGQTDDDPGQTDDDPGKTDDDPAPVSKPPSRAQQEIIKLRERAQKAEDDIRKAKEELEALRKPVVDDLWEKEEATLKKVDPNSWEAYNIKVARDNRSNQKAIADLKIQSADREDRHAFEQLKLEKPKMYDAYKDDVEKRYKSLLASGHVVPRMMIFDNILGEALRTGKLKTKPTPPVNRGETPRARSDAPRNVSAGRNSPEAVAKRLENQVI